MPDCRCEPCGSFCECNCHEQKESLRTDGGRRDGDLIADDPTVPTERRLP